METVISTTIWIVLGVYLAMALLVVWRAWCGENSVSRLMGLDLSATLTLAILVIVSILQNNTLYLDVGIALAALSYISTVALAKFISDHKVF
jgi:multisubunit Na+/H+ antiporter MnhF subunit